MNGGGEPVLRPGPKGIKAVLMRLLLAAVPYVFAFCRRWWPIPRVGKIHVVTRHDDVREAMRADPAFMVPYKSNLDVLLDKQPVFVGMADTPEYRSQLARLHELFEPGDMDMLAARAEAQAEAIVAAANGSIEVVDELVRTVTFTMLQDFFGVPNPPGADLRVWSTRMFEYQFMGHDAALVAEIGEIAPALRGYVDALIAERKQAGRNGDDLLGRALRMQAKDAAEWDDVFIRTMLCALIIGGPPQPPMVLPQALEQLLRRPQALRGAEDCARAGDGPLLLGHILEALRFDPISPFLVRNAVHDYTLAAGTSRPHPVKAGAKLIVAIESAMADPRRIPDPKSFDPRRQAYQYFHFGYGLHECFGEPINRATFAPMLAPLLRRGRVRRTAGKDGKLSYAGMFPAALTVEFG